MPPAESGAAATGPGGAADRPTAGLAWAEVEWTVLAAGERAAGLPADTRATPYMARTRGLAAAPEPGGTATVLTVTGRRQTGTVVAVNPGYTHSFGAPIPAWTEMRERIRGLLHPAVVPDRQRADAGGT